MWISEQYGESRLDERAFQDTPIPSPTRLLSRLTCWCCRSRNANRKTAKIVTASPPSVVAAIIPTFGGVELAIAGDVFTAEDEVDL